MNVWNDTTTVKTYRDDATCECCGRSIRNVVEIDGVKYGIRCCEAFLPRFAKVVKGVVEIDYTSVAVAELGQDRFIRFWAKPVDHLKDYLGRAIASGADTVEGVKMIIAAKEAVRAQLAK